jgi:hypothetical protein
MGISVAAFGVVSMALICSGICCPF